MSDEDVVAAVQQGYAFSGPTVQLGRSFDIPDVWATHVQIRVLGNQCLGYAGFRGEQDNDPTNDTDCATTANADDVRIAELEVFGR